MEDINFSLESHDSELSFSREETVLSMNDLNDRQIVMDDFSEMEVKFDSRASRILK